MDVSKIREVPLTRIGQDAAIEFGCQLSPDRDYHIYYSPIFRCQDTAEKIYNGIIAQGNHATLNSQIMTLLKVKHRQRFIDEVLLRDKQRYVHYWIAGFYPQNKVESCLEYSKRLSHIIQNSMQCAQPQDCFIFVGHDVNHLGFRFITTGIPVDNQWLSFLGGFYLQVRDGNFVVFHRGDQFNVPLPYWWDSGQLN
jgi:broad specificity phosphatase PhoE